MSIDDNVLTVITPVYNGEKYLEDNILSLINQTSENWRQIIVDGGSTDNTLKIIKNYVSLDDRISYISEPDNGMYDAIFKGFSMAKSQYLSWLNADDMYFRHTVKTVLDIFNQNSNIKWLIGTETKWDDNGILWSVSYPKYLFTKLIKLGFYNGKVLGYIQQESTFFTKSILEGLDTDTKQRIISSNLIGDFILWKNFANLTKLHVVPTVLGGFRAHPKNNSRYNNLYQEELKKYGYKIHNKMFAFLIRIIITPISILLGHIILNRRIMKLKNKIDQKKDDKIS